MLYVAAVLTAKPGQRSALLREIEPLGPLVRAEAGCIDWAPCVDIAGGPEDLHRLGPDRLAVVERWEDLSALEAHATSALMVEWRARIADVLLSRDVWVLQSA